MKHKILVTLLVLITLVTGVLTLTSCSKNQTNNKDNFSVEDTELYLVKVEFKKDMQTSVYKSISVYDNGVVIFIDREDKETRGKLTDEDIAMIKDIIQRDKYAESWVKVTEEINLNLTYVYKLEAEVEYVNQSEELVKIIKSLVISSVQRNSKAVA